MKKIAYFSIAFAALTLVGCQSKREQTENEEKAEVETQEHTASPVEVQLRNEAADMSKTLQLIVEGFRKINEAEGIVTKSEAEGSDRQVIMENMAFIQKKLKDNRQHINELQQLLRNARQTSKETKAAYEAMVDEFAQQLENKGKEIDKLKEQLAQQNIIIAEQDEQIEQLNENVSDLTTQNQEKERAMADQDKKLHTAWYVYGTKKELREQKILERSDVLKSSNFNKSYFKEIDTRETTTIRLYSDKVDIKTSHPSDSYVIEEDKNEECTLRITNPEKFWSVSKYLVVVVK